MKNLADCFHLCNLCTAIADPFFLLFKIEMDKTDKRIKNESRVSPSGNIEELRIRKTLLVISGRPHQYPDRRRRRRVFSRGRVLVNRVRVVDLEQRRDGGGPDVEDPGVGHLTVDLHHCLVFFVLDDAVCNLRDGEGDSWLSTSS